ncbi:HmuY family protein [Flavobacterium gelatinilyticum]|uniref:HmuY family protein n=1 Tax=Flavobacterium gelatinilyticum TaxID=3003260 RepID=UPI00248139D4|nr:HmuY family protein [Flavobacterium gelatinilyticum]
MITTLKKWHKLLFVIASISFTACSSNEEDNNTSLVDGKSTVISDLAGDTGASMGDGTNGKEQRGFHTFLFRFSDQKQIWLHTKADSLQYMKTKDWDIAFTGPYNSEVFVNNAKYQYNPGYEGPAENTSVVLISEAYRNVDQAPSDETFNNSDVTKIGWASSASSAGWFYYSLNTHIMQAIPDRTYAIRLPNGKYAKLELLNAYKGNPPAVTDLNWPAPYFTFRYYVQQDGSKNLSTK